jgi:hypothetical protein
VDWRAYPELATAGLWCTPTDLVRFAHVIQDAVAGEATALLPRHLALEMVTPQVGDWGLGLRVSSNGPSQWFSHGGDNHGYQCALIGAVHRRQAVAVMTASDLQSASVGPVRDEHMPRALRRTVLPNVWRHGECSCEIGEPFGSPGPGGQVGAADDPGPLHVPEQRDRPLIRDPGLSATVFVLHVRRVA